MAGRRARFVQLRNDYIDRVNFHFTSYCYPQVPPRILELRKQRANSIYLPRLDRAYFIEFKEDTDQSYHSMEFAFVEAWTAIKMAISNYNHEISTFRTRFVEKLNAKVRSK